MTSSTDLQPHLQPHHRDVQVRDATELDVTTHHGERYRVRSEVMPSEVMTEQVWHMYSLDEAGDVTGEIMPNFVTRMWMSGYPPMFTWEDVATDITEGIARYHDTLARLGELA